MPRKAAEKLVYFEPLGYVDRSQWEMFDFPPEGYRFVLPEPALRDRLVVNDLVLSRLYPWLDRAFRLLRVPHLLLKSYVDSLTRKPPAGAALTYAYNHLVFRREPWVCQLEFPTNLVGRDVRILRRWRRLVERAFGSPWCRKVIVWGEEGRRALEQSLDCRRFGEKIETVPLTVRPRDPAGPRRRDGTVRLLFVGSGNRSGEFDLKGGKEAIEAYARLCPRYDKVSLVIRSDMPPAWMRRCRELPNVRVIDRQLPWPELEKEYRSADIFLQAALFPGYHVAPLDAMSFGLPVVATDYGDCREKVKDGVTGFLVPKSSRIPDLGEGGLPARHTGLRGVVETGYRNVDEEIVRGLVEKTSALIEDADLRRRMGEAGRREVDEGPLSIAARNQRLKRIFDEATA
ncbi:MAG: glycosyltransferase family 4 protein [Chloroflexi bacterium]|nr:glycosyltransferase family 4 protein [Chloroflexota bacterium]